jgi:hypothetical protein
VLWIGLYLSDFLMTMASARLYQRGARERIAFEGSDEITPYYQGDVDALRMLSPRFVLAMALSCLLQLALWFLTMRSHLLPQVYVLALGMMINIQLAIHIRHIRNFFLFRAVLAGDGISGRIEYARGTMLRMSAIELLSFAALYALLFLVTLSWFVLGGVLICVATAFNHRALATKHAVPKVTAA